MRRHLERHLSLHTAGLNTWNTLMRRCAPPQFGSHGSRLLCMLDRLYRWVLPWETRPATQRLIRATCSHFKWRSPASVLQQQKLLFFRLKWIITTYMCVKLDFYDIDTSPQTSADLSVLRKPHIWFCCMNKLHVNIQWQDTDVASLVFEPWRSTHHSFAPESLWRGAAVFLELKYGVWSQKPAKVKLWNLWEW